MNKSELIRSVANNTRHTQKEVEEILNEALGEIIDLTTVMNERVLLHGFGAFEPVHRGRREMVNPRTREKVITRERRTFKFVVSKTLNDKL